MNNDQIHHLYRLADVFYRKHKLQHMPKDDFKQMCALKAVTNISAASKYPTIDHFLVTMVHQTAREERYSKFNLTKSKDKKWHEVRTHHVEFTEELEIADMLPSDLDVRSLLTTATKSLNDLESKILMLMYEGNTVDNIAENLKVSRRSIYNYLVNIRSKVKELL